MQPRIVFLRSNLAGRIPFLASDLIAACPAPRQRPIHTLTRQTESSLPGTGTGTARPTSYTFTPMLIRSTHGSHCQMETARLRFRAACPEPRQRPIHTLTRQTESSLPGTGTGTARPTSYTFTPMLIRSTHGSHCQMETALLRFRAVCPEPRQRPIHTLTR